MTSAGARKTPGLTNSSAGWNMQADPLQYQIRMIERKYLQTFLRRIPSLRWLPTYGVACRCKRPLGWGHISYAGFHKCTQVSLSQSMQILFLTHRLPYPPDKGERIRAFHELRYLAERHEVDLFCFADSQESAENKQALQGICRSVYVEVLKGRADFCGPPVTSLPVSLCHLDSFTPASSTLKCDRRCANETTT